LAVEAMSTRKKIGPCPQHAAAKRKCPKPADFRHTDGNRGETMTKKTKGPKDDGIKVSAITKRLPVKLDDDVLLERGHQLVENMRKTATAEDEREKENKRRKSDIDLLEGVTSKLCAIISTGYEEREVDCEVRRDFKHGKVTTIRTDTGEVVDERTMTAEERQEMMPFAEKVESRDPAKGKGGDPFADAEKEEGLGF
jgi:hypothetical protein